MAQVSLNEVTKIYPGNVNAVDRFTLSIPDGEFIVLVGPSGCGKSTTLRMVAGLEEITSGTIAIGERIVNDVHPKDRDIAMVFQNYALYPHMTVYKNMAFGLKLRRMPKPEIRERVLKTARVLGIQELLERKPKALSGGQRQRVALGRAIVREPKAFLFDEPLSNLDAKLRVETRAELKALHMRLGTTTIYVTHDQEEAMTLGDRVVIMSDGLIQQVGTPLEVYGRPVNRFVAGFLGTPPMNFLDGRVTTGADGGLWFVESGDAADGAGEGIRIPVPSTLREAASKWVDREVVLGVRPEGIHVAETPAGASGNTVTLNVLVVEPLGDRMDVHLETSLARRVVARMPVTEGVVPGEPATVAVDPRSVHLFEPGEFGPRIAT